MGRNTCLLIALLLLTPKVPRLAHAEDGVAGYVHSGFERRWVGGDPYSVDGDQLYVGGRFEYIGDRRVNHIARWDGEMWHGVGRGLSNTVVSLAVHDGSLVAGVEVPGFVERWDGSSWGPMGQPLETRVTDLLSNGGELFVALLNASAHPVRRWNGEDWEPAGTGLGSGTALSLSWHDGALYVGGFLYTDSGGSSEQRSVFRLSEGEWSPVGDMAMGLVVDVVATADGVFVAGDPSLNSYSGLSRFDGTVWSPLDDSQQPHNRLSLVDGQVVAYDYGSLTAADDYTGLAAWTPQGWLPLVPSGRGPGLMQGSGLWRGALPVTATHGGGPVSIWRNGAVETLVESGGHGLDGSGFAAATFEGDLVVVGRFEFAGDQAARNVARWDGQRWMAMGSGFDEVPVAIFTYGDELFVGGNFESPSPETVYTVLKWESGNWRPIMEVDHPGATVTRFHATRFGLAASGSIDTTTGESLRPGVMLWDSLGWAKLADGLPTVRSEFATWNEDLVVLGGPAFEGPDKVYGWSGSAWELWFAADGIQKAWPDWIGEVGGLLCVAGSVFDPVTGDPVSVVAWDGFQWRVLGDTVDVRIDRLAEVSDRIVAGSWERLFTLEAHTWKELPAAPDGWTRDLVGWNGDLVVLGDFARFGTRASVGIGLWSFAEMVAVPDSRRVSAKPVEVLGGYPNPLNPRTTLRFHLANTGPVELRIVDARGREVWTRAWSSLQPGRHELTWDGSDERGRLVASGVYRVTVQSGNATDSGSVTVVR